ncbi:MAG TPA: hypothetical protein VG603_06650 [Chitinophagales bacterium]|nr:hypothetical protein [Chitinophagales bacterium]
MKVNQNIIATPNPSPTVIFIDMNSFFASCEQQVNYWLRHRPIGVCVYTGKHGAVIALSKEAKKMGIKPNTIDQIMKVCPQFVPLETNPNRYREFHIKIIKVLKQFSDDVVPKSIDEAIVNVSSYQLVYKDMVQLAKDIKRKINEEVGDWLTCSIGIAPNAFLAKLGASIQKPDGLVVITPENIDEHLSKLSLTQLPGIAKNMALRMVMGGITSPVQLRHTPPEVLRKVCGGIIGNYWHYRLNFKEVDIHTDEYKSMQAMRQISKAQRASLETLHDILRALCIQLEKRMVKTGVFCQFIGFSCRYENGYGWDDHLTSTNPVQDGTEMMHIITGRMKKFEAENYCEPIMNTNIVRMSIWVTRFIEADLVQYSLFENNTRKDTLRRAVYSIKDKFGFEKIMRAAEIQDTPVMKDVIGFGSIKDLV